MPELFATEFERRVRAQRPVRITCVVCERIGDQAVRGISLCRECGNKADQLTDHIKEMLASYERTMQDTWSSLEQALPNDPDDALARRWGAFLDAVARHAPDAATAERKAKFNMTDSLAALIRLWVAHKDARAIYMERRVWFDRADLAITLYLDEVL